ncbi:uncharacterized protein LOC128786937 isoform X2 [Vidua chalybeata]|uniref:uncharacterized protein LOC128786937 isoform X2 n=1 Tax=Vidua chalybeata TaxID=81927 RepID=UPI0023A87CF6|nr:uncharacterized protein LOC128786937 isoform X2 [Vidua chalybeata]
MLRNAALFLVAVCSGHFKETITKTRERSEVPLPKMLAPCLLRRAVLTAPFIFVVALLVTEPVRADQEAGTAIPAENRNSASSGGKEKSVRLRSCQSTELNPGDP